MKLFWRITLVIIGFKSSWNIWFLKELFDIFSIVFQESTFKNSKQTEKTVYISTDKRSRNHIFHQSLYQRLIIRNSFQISMYIFTPKLKNKVLKFSMLLVKKSSLWYIKKYKIRTLLEELFEFNKKAILQEFMIP